MDSRRGQLRHIGLQAPVQEIEDVVTRRIHAGGEGRPGDRRQRRKRCSQSVVDPLCAKLRQVREFAFGQVLLGKPRVQPIESEEDHSPDARVPESLPPPYHTPCHAQRPQQQGNQAHHETRKKREKRSEKGEARARSDVGHTETFVSARPKRRRQGDPQHETQGLPHRSLPSTNGTSQTFSCWIGPWPKYPSSPNSSPWSEVMVMYVFSGTVSNSSSTTPSRYRTASICRCRNSASFFLLNARTLLLRSLPPTIDSSRSLKTAC